MACYWENLTFTSVFCPTFWRGIAFLYYCEKAMRWTDMYHKWKKTHLTKR